jgi:hypothetical protein
MELYNGDRLEVMKGILQWAVAQQASQPRTLIENSSALSKTNRTLKSHKSA